MVRYSFSNYGSRPSTRVATNCKGGGDFPRIIYDTCMGVFTDIFDKPVI
jgi:hypothetical protein